MSELKLGQIIRGDAFKDAIHVAVAPVVAAHSLKAGDHVGFLSDGRIGATEATKNIGVVDPFLKEHVSQNDHFWLFLYPQTVTGMRHEWQHPAFKDQAPADTAPAPKTKSERWLHDFAAQNDITFNTLMEGARNWVDHEDYLCLGGLLEGKYVPDEFWSHYKEVTGKEGSGSFFTCSC